MIRPRRARTTLLLAAGLAAVLLTLPQCQRGTTATQSAQASSMAVGLTPTTGSTAAGMSSPQDPQRDRLRLLVSGSMQGRLEPCGCASGQLGGLPRRRQHIAEQNAYDVLLEGGGLTAGSNELDLMKASTAVMVLFQMQHPYDALGLAGTDLQLPLDEWLAMLATVPAVVTSDVDCDREDWPGVPFAEKTVRDHTVRIASLARTLPAGLAGEKSPFRVLPPTAAWQRALAGAADSTLRVLMLHDTDTNARQLIPTLEPSPDLVVCMDATYPEPPAHPELIAGVPVVYPGTRGRILLELTLARGPDGPQLGYDMVPLPASKTATGGGGDPDTKAMILMHREDVAMPDENGMTVLRRLANREPTPTGAQYSGNAACALCHEQAMKDWQQTRHAQAWKTLIDAEKDPKRYGWPVTKYPDCVECHVVGYGEQSGFVDAERTPQLWDVGCEACHGPGSNHCDDPAEHVLGMHGGIEASQLCVQCHDFEQSPDFLYGDKWAQIKHGREAHMPPRKK